MVTAFAWEALPAVRREEGRLAAWVAAIGWTWRGAVAVPTATDGALVEIVSGGARWWIAVPARVARAIADVALDRGEELAAPRPVTPVERALAALVIADAVARVDGAATVALIDAVPAGDHAAARIAIARPIAGEVVAIGTPGPIARRLEPHRAAALTAVRGAVVAARAALAPSRLRGLAAGDIVVVGPPSAGLAIGRGSIAASLDRAAGVATVAGRYAREASMSDEPHAQLADDLRIALTIVVGEVELSVRELLALAPGQTVALGRPVGGAVELRAGGRLVGRGELVVVDGDLGVRLIDVLSTTPSPC